MYFHDSLYSYPYHVLVMVDSAIAVMQDILFSIQLNLYWLDVAYMTSLLHINFYW
jgi:hypothetical protein